MADYRNEFEASSAAYSPEPRNLRRSRGTAMAVAIALAVVLVGVLVFAARSGIDKRSVETRLKQWTDAANQVAGAEGYKIAVTHGEVAIEGSLFSKVAHVRSPVITLTPTVGGPELTKTIAAENAYLLPTWWGGEDFTLRINDPLMMTDRFGRLRITSGEAMEWHVEEVSGDKGTGFAFSFPLPPHVSFERLAQQTEAAVSTTDVTFGPQSRLNGMVDTAAGTYRQDAALSGVVVKSSNGQYQVGSVTSQMETASENGALLTHYLVHVGQMSFEGMLKPLGPIDADLDAELTEPQPGDAAVSQTLGRERNLSLEKLLIALPSANLLAKADLKLVPGELVPFGTGSIEIDHPVKLIDALESSGVARGVDKSLIVTMLQKVSPAWKGDDSRVIVDLKRDVNAPFYLGALTFENFTAQLLQQLFQSSGAIPPATLPVQPATTAPGVGTPGVAAPAVAAPAAPVGQAPATTAAPATQAPDDETDTGEESGDASESDEPAIGGSDAPAASGTAKPAPSDATVPAPAR